MEAPEADPQEVSDQQEYDEIVDAVAKRVLSSKCLYCLFVCLFVVCVFILDIANVLEVNEL